MVRITSTPKDRLLNSLRFAGDDIKLADSAKIQTPEDIAIGNNVILSSGCVLSGDIRIGDNVYLGPNTVLIAGEAGIVIDANTMIGKNCSIYATGDDIEGIIFPRIKLPCTKGHSVSAPVHIGRQVIIGSLCTVTPGVTLKEGGVFKPGTYINQSTDPWSIYGGSILTCEGKRPKKVIKEGNDMGTIPKRTPVHYCYI